MFELRRAAAQRSVASCSAIGRCHYTLSILRTATFRCIMLRNRALSLYPVHLADSNVPLHHAPQSSIVTIPCPSCGQQRSVASCSAIEHCHYTLSLLRTATFRCIMLRNRALSLYPVPLADSNVPLHHAPQSGIITIPCPSCGQQRSVASCSAIGHYHYTLSLLRTATFRCIMLRNRALSLYPVPLADSNVPLHHAPQSGIITIPCPSCGQQRSVASCSAIEHCHYTLSLLRTAFINYVISTK